MSLHSDNDSMSTDSLSPAAKNRLVSDFRKAMHDFKVTVREDKSEQEFWVIINGPPETPFEGGQWKVHVEVPNAYPYKSPSIGFVNKIFHPNIDEMSGSVCLDVINQTWSPMYEMLNIFDSFLPQLLRYPNPSDPLNGDAAALMMGNIERYNSKVKEYVRRYAMVSETQDTQDGPQQEEEDDDDDDGYVSSNDGDEEDDK